jgi:hypothetical protein
MLQTPTPLKSYGTFGARKASYGISSALSWLQHKLLPLPVRFPGFNSFTSYRTGLESGLKEATFVNADLRWTNFRGADLSDADFTNSILWGAILTNASLREAKLNNADLTGVDLSGADLSDACTEGACFIGARFSSSTRFPKMFGKPEKKGMVSNMTEYLQVS